MADAQTIANDIGAALRAAESAAASENATATKAKLDVLHAALATGFAYGRDVLDLDLDWDQVAGNAPSGKPGGPQTQGGGSKDPPPSGA